jgi:ABC-type nitrate/sulfonate/bicarbonate transport system substrate-binding protein
MSKRCAAVLTSLAFVAVMATTAALLLVGSPGAATAQSPAAVTVGLLPPFPFYWASYVAAEQGFFKAQGLNIETIQFTRPSEAVQALVGGSVHFVQVSADAFINAIDAGAAIVIVGQTVGDPAFSVVAQPELTSWSQLKGKTVGVSAPKDGAAIVFRLMAEANGLKEGDVSFIPVGITPNRYAALKSRAVYVAVLAPPHDFQAVDEGYRLLARSDTVLPRYSFIMVGASASWAQTHREQVMRYLAALDRATEWLYQPANRTAAVDILDKAMRRVSRPYLERIHRMYFEESGGRIITRGVRIEMEGLRIYGQKMKDLAILRGPIDPGRWTDSSYRDAIGR